MTEFSTYTTETTPLQINTYSDGQPIEDLSILNGGAYPGGVAWPKANRAIYIPLYVPYQYVVRRMYWINGSVIGSNVSTGLYTFDGERLYGSGTVAQVGTSLIQYVTPSTPIPLSPGRYYVAFAISSITANNGVGLGTAGSGLASYKLLGIVQQESALPVPATMAPETLAAEGASLPFVGITRTATGF